MQYARISSPALNLREASSIDVHLYGRLCARRRPPDNQLPIPGQLSQAESQFLYYLLADEWPGGSTVLEIGTLFGSSTQSIGLGMASNPRRGNARLFAVDCFLKYFDKDEFVRQLEPLLVDQPDWSNIVRVYEAEGFEQAYRALHRGRLYSPFHEIRRVYLPSVPADSDERLRTVLNECGPVGVAFIDSAKAWHPLRVLAAHLCDQLVEGAFVIWQDYRWFNSYAIPVFNAIFARYFELLAVVDNTHAFRYRGGLDYATVTAAMPPRCTDLGLQVLEPMFRAASAHAGNRKDSYGSISAALQLAFVTAECGHIERAHELLAAVRSLPGSAVHRVTLDHAHRELSAFERN